MRPEDLVVRDPRAAQLGERLDDRARIAGIGDGGDPGGPAVCKPAARGGQEGLG